VWGSSLISLPALGIGPPINRWTPREIALDVLHHSIYIAVADAAYRATG
jgi:hypothetical protein